MGSNNFEEAKQEAWRAISNLSRYSAKIITDYDFQKLIDEMANHFSTYKQLWLTGHFSNSFNKKIKEYPTDYPGCDFRVLAIKPGGNQKNIQALEAMRKKGANVKIHNTLHARMFIGSYEEGGGILIIGSYDFNREGISGENENIGIFTENPEMIRDAKQFFLKMWEQAHDELK